MRKELLRKSLPLEGGGPSEMVEGVFLRKLTIKTRIKMPLNYNSENIELAKVLRKNMTPQEKHLWYDYLADYKPDFQR